MAWAATAPAHIYEHQTPSKTTPTPPHNPVSHTPSNAARCHAQHTGVQFSDGDGTVPLISLGLMCRKGWRQGSGLNPGGMRVVTREYRHRPVSVLQDSRWGGRSVPRRAVPRCAAP